MFQDMGLTGGIANMVQARLLVAPVAIVAEKSLIAGQLGTCFPGATRQTCDTPEAVIAAQALRGAQSTARHGANTIAEYALRACLSREK